MLLRWWTTQRSPSPNWMALTITVLVFRAAIIFDHVTAAATTHRDGRLSPLVVATPQTLPQYVDCLAALRAAATWLPNCLKDTSYAATIHGARPNTQGESVSPQRPPRRGTGRTERTWKSLNIINTRYIKLHIQTIAHCFFHYSISPFQKSNSLPF